MGDVRPTCRARGWSGHFPFAEVAGIMAILSVSLPPMPPRTHHRIATHRSSIHGRGVFAVSALHAGETIIEYKGKRLTHAQADDLYGDGGEGGHTFLFTLNARYIIDANQQGNSARWINHSCAPNCQALVVESASGDARRDRVVIEALRDIRPGEELTYDYGITLDVPHTARLKKLWTCRCGAPQCTGTLLKARR